MDSFRKDTEMVVEEEDQDEDYSCKNAELDNRPDLFNLSLISLQVAAWS